MGDIYRIGQLGHGFDDRKFESQKVALQAFENKLDRIQGNLMIKLGGRHEKFGMARTHKETMERVDDILDHIDVGRRVIVRGVRESEHDAFMIHRTMESEGQIVVRAAISQLGVDYSWADVDPLGGGSSGFDCSGLVKWCYAQAGEELPHSADAMDSIPSVHIFQERSKIKAGDMVFYCYGRLGPGHADHMGIALDKDRGIFASSSQDEVVRQNIDLNGVLHYGFMPSVTGAH